MKQFLPGLLVFTMAGCAPDDTSVAALAARLSNEGANGLSQDHRDSYAACGVKALSYLPKDRIEAALKAPDPPAIWAILGSEALDRYVAFCRETDLQRG